MIAMVFTLIEISTGTTKDVNLSLDLQSTSSLLSAQKKTIGKNAKVQSNNIIL